MDGLLVIDKPAGPTSHDVVARMRRVLGERRIGHTGTLDPAATGVLPLVLGRATRLARFLSAADKTYQAVIRLGMATDTYDADGTAMAPRHDGAWPSHVEIDAALDACRGASVQQPPAFSAKKIAGRRSYRIARGARAAPPVLPAPVSVTVSRLEIVSVEGDLVTLMVDCSAGFYVRSLAHDLGERLGIGAHLAALRRTRSGECVIEDALPLEAAEDDRARAQSAVIPLDRMLEAFSAVVLTDEGVRHAVHGRDLGANDIAEPMTTCRPCFRLMTRRGQLVGIGEPTKTPGLLHPSVVLM